MDKLEGNQVWYHPNHNMIVETNAPEGYYGLSDGNQYPLRIIDDVFYGPFSYKMFPEDFVLVGELWKILI